MSDYSFSIAQQSDARRAYNRYQSAQLLEQQLTQQIVAQHPNLNPDKLEGLSQQQLVDKGLSEHEAALLTQFQTMQDELQKGMQAYLAELEQDIADTQNPHVKQTYEQNAEQAEQFLTQMKQEPKEPDTEQASITPDQLNEQIEAINHQIGEVQAATPHGLIVPGSATAQELLTLHAQREQLMQAAEQMKQNPVVNAAALSQQFTTAADPYQALNDAAAVAKVQQSQWEKAQQQAQDYWNPDAMTGDFGAVSTDQLLAASSDGAQQMGRVYQAYNPQQQATLTLGNHADDRMNIKLTGIDPAQSEVHDLGENRYRVVQNGTGTAYDFTRVVQQTPEGTVYTTHRTPMKWDDAKQAWQPAGPATPMHFLNDRQSGTIVENAPLINLGSNEQANITATAQTLASITNGTVNIADLSQPPQQQQQMARAASHDATAASHQSVEARTDALLKAQGIDPSRNDRLAYDARLSAKAQAQAEANATETAAQPSDEMTFAEAKAILENGKKAYLAEASKKQQVGFTDPVAQARKDYRKAAETAAQHYEKQGVSHTTAWSNVRAIENGKADAVQVAEGSSPSSKATPSSAPGRGGNAVSAAS